METRQRSRVKSTSPERSQNNRPTQEQLTNTTTPSDPPQNASSGDLQGTSTSSVSSKTTSTWWLILSVTDLLINTSACAQTPIWQWLHIPEEEVFVTLEQLWWASLFRLALVLHLYHFRLTDDGVGTRGLRFTCYANLFGAVPTLCFHLLVRCLMDAEVASPCSTTYWMLITWHALCVAGHAGIAWRTLPGERNQRSGTEQRDQRGRLLVGAQDVGKSTLYKLFLWYRPHLKLIVLGYIFLVVHSIVDAMLPYYKAKVIDVIKSDRPLEGLTEHVVYMAGLSILGTVMTTLWSSVTMIVRSGLHFRIRSRLFRWIIYQEMSFFDKTKSGELTASLSSDAEALGGVLNRLDSVIKTGTRIVGMIFFMARLSWQLTLVVVTGNAFLVVATHFYGKYTKSIHKRSQECRRQANVIAQEVLSSMRTVRAFGSEEGELSKYTEKCQEQFDLQLTEAWVSPSYRAVDQLLHMTLMTATIFYGGHLVVMERISSGDLVSFVLYLTKLGNAMSTLLNVHQWLMRMLGASEKVFQYLDADPVTSPDGTEAPLHLAGSIQFKDVDFAYPTRPDVNVLNSLSLNVAPGEVVALVGPSGAGKTSVFNLLQRFYPPASGQVTLDARPLAEYQHRYFRSKMTIVSQEPTLFARSIRENICYGLDPAYVTDLEVTRSATDANAASFIDKFPDGYDTYVGEKGLQLSGGQKQRVAIARALIRDPTILLLDEATSALDTESEKQVQEALHRTVGGRTVVIIAHRLSTVRRADRVLVLNRGSIVEEGSHDELIQRHGLYYNLVKWQLLREGDT